MERYTELALNCSKNECARTDTVFLPITEVCNETASLICLSVCSCSVPIWWLTYLTGGVADAKVAEWEDTGCSTESPSAALSLANPRE